MTDQTPKKPPKKPSIPEVVPAAHIAPETPPVSPAELPASDAASDSSSAIPAASSSSAMRPIADDDADTPDDIETAEDADVIDDADEADLADEMAEEEAPAPEEAPEFIRTTPIPKMGRSTPKARSKPVSTPGGPTKERYRLVLVVSTLRSLSVTFAAAVIVATIFMWWTSPGFLSAQTLHNLAPIQQTAERQDATATFLPTPVWFNRIGVLAGHSGIATYGPTKGNVDPGTVCSDGFNEAQATLATAQQVVAMLKGRGFTVDLLQEWDLKLDNYQAAAFISLHADSCADINDGYNHSGFKVTYPTVRLTVRDRDTQLNDCVKKYYGEATGLPFTPEGITANMTDYHAFHPALGHAGIAQTTPGVILELGVLSYDRDMLQNHTDKMSQGVFNSLLCFLDPMALSTAQPSAPVLTPTAGGPTPVIAPTDATAGQPTATAHP